MKNNRLIWLDTLKGFLMLLVIFGHSTHAGEFNDYYVTHINNALSSIAMPCFMACSGWVFKIGGGKNIRRFKQLMIPYFIWSFISFVFLYYGNQLDSDKSVLDIFMRPDAFNIWFLWALFWIFCLFELTIILSNRLDIPEIWIVISIGILLMMVMVVLDIRVLGFQFISYYYLFYAIGYFYRKYEKFQIEDKKTISLIIVTWAFLAYSWDMHELPNWIPQTTILPSSILQYLYRGITSALGVIMCLALFSKLKSNEGILGRVLVECGKMSLGLYVVHIIILNVIHSLLTPIMHQTTPFLFIMLEFTIVLGVAYSIVKLLSKYEVTNQYLLGKV
jgi:fucose 4-O-acetylase-like acetyltransferase